MRTTAGRVLAALAVILFGLTLPLLSAQSAGAAQATLRQSDPSADQTIARLPEVITLVFDESPSEVKITVVGPDGVDVVSSPPNIRGVGVRQPVRAGAAGRYTVSYEMSPVTGPPAVGSFSFTVTEGGTAPAPSGAAPPPPAANPPAPTATATTGPVPTVTGTAPAAEPAATITGTPPSATAIRDSDGTSSRPLVFVLGLLGVAIVVTAVVLGLRIRARRSAG
ncbi:copper resistance protein CopC [Micromonospora sp. NBC_01796]|uniref:copper resistance protein CopC n=1 Tax=Micromonospora sp. NBC_01796 TaxID=2975987 RepID=UPI002DDAEB89|nr:copper resistance protein CopC [Micromonospora sp. NBC_01796]WSA84923.1 copper resistance protein CopC [Micromonospora sp. NBC_01796]